MLRHHRNRGQRKWRDRGMIGVQGSFRDQGANPSDRGAIFRPEVARTRAATLDTRSPFLRNRARFLPISVRAKTVDLKTHGYCAPQLKFLIYSLCSFMSYTTHVTYVISVKQSHTYLHYDNKTHLNNWMSLLL